MSSPRVTKIWEGLAEQLHRMGYTSALAKSGIPTCIRWIGRDAGGLDAVLIDLDAASWASGQRRAILVATPAGTKPTDFADFHTQSHAAGHFLDGSVSLTLMMEALANGTAGQTGTQAAFQRDLLHILRGQEGAPVDMVLTDHATEPTWNGVNGAGSTATNTDAGTMLPYGMAYPGGI